MNATNDIAIYRNPDINVEARVNDLLGRMTFGEKVRQLERYWGATFMSGMYSSMDNKPVSDARIQWDKVMSRIGDDGVGCIYGLFGAPKVYNQLQQYAIEQTRLGIPILFCEDKHIDRVVDIGTISIKSLDIAVSRVLNQKIKLGLFEKPYVE
ncbi:hypothetical protein [Cohnella herbarum]|uniref:beta-glucosidase n=1 Tax=Cohnella herbarum TaxID=2728023 RepID=A0A7Z2VPC9_9BACL|nr:hypothetical protein [Cohnella herbarum]QJD87041.1 hypothetical protein HH215_30275 [Cohnella herbarum]